MVLNCDASRPQRDDCHRIATVKPSQHKEQHEEVELHTEYQTGALMKSNAEHRQVVAVIDESSM